MRERNLAVEPEQGRSSQEQRGDQSCGTAKDRAAQVKERGHGQRAGKNADPHHGRLSVREQQVHQTAEPDVDDVTRRVRLLLCHAELAHGVGEIDRVPVIENPRAKGNVAEKHEEKEAGSQPRVLAMGRCVI